jgi:beta-mannosidase
MHIWDVWNHRDYLGYRDYRPRFASEFGFQAPATATTLREALGEDEFAVGSAAMAHHQKHPRGDEALADRLGEHFPAVDAVTDWLYLTQLNQARAVGTAVEWCRSLHPRCTGTLYWQLNDCWPGVTWAAIDSLGRVKPLWWATRRFYAERLVTFQPPGPGENPFDRTPVLHAINDTDEPWPVSLAVTRMTFDGTVLGSSEVRLNVAGRGRSAVEGIDPALLEPRRRGDEFLVARADGMQATWFFARDREINYPAPEFEAFWQEQGRQLVVKADVLIRDLMIQPDVVCPGATVSDGLVTLLPGQSVTLEIESSRPVDLATLLDRPVLQCANFYGAIAHD